MINKKIEIIITDMLIRMAISDWKICPFSTYEDWVKSKKRYIQHATREIIKLIEQ